MRNRVLRHPATNAIGLAVFSAFYSVIFLGFSPCLLTGTGESQHPFWRAWDNFLLTQGHRWLAIILLVLTVIALAILLRHRSVYDEYHAAILLRCLAAALVLALAGIGGFFALVLLDPVGIVSKLALMVSVNWASVVLADLGYLLVCRRR
jgi:hypothetical protein